MRANSGLTIYLVVLHASMVLLLLVIGVLWLIVFVRKIWARAHRCRYVLGLRTVFKNALITLAVATMATFVLFGAGLGEVVMGVVKLAWGGAPAANPGMMYWSWPVIQIVCVAVVWAPAGACVDEIRTCDVLDYGGHHAVCAVGIRVLGIVYLLISRESAAGARMCGKYR